MTSLYLVRHGVAADPSAAYPTDDVRPLTEEGVSRMRLQARGLRELGVTLDLVLTSPLVRCRQTADLLAEGLGDAPVEVLPALRPGGRPEAILAALAVYRRHGSLALVGHEPSMGHLAAALVGASGLMPFKRGAVCRIDVDTLPPRGAGQLVYFLPPRVTRKLGAMYATNR